MDKETKMLKAKTLGMLGLVKKAGKLIIGTDRVTDTVRSNTPGLTLIASDASDNTKKRAINCCDYYKAEYQIIDVTAEELAHAIGRSNNISVIFITDKNFTAVLKELIMGCKSGF